MYRVKNTVKYVFSRSRVIAELPIGRRSDLRLHQGVQVRYGHESSELEFGAVRVRLNVYWRIYGLGGDLTL